MSEFMARPHEVLVRFVRTDAYENTDVAMRARATLGADERWALDRVRAPEAHRDSLAAHALARTMVARLAGCPASQIRIGAFVGGCLEVLAPRTARRLRFSLSHADGIALCAVSSGMPVGADVESRRNVGPDPLGAAATVCSRREREALAALPLSEQADRFLALWTRKEAIAKASGHGFLVPLQNIPLDDQSPWRVAMLRLTPDHLAAVAVEWDGDGALAIRCEEEPVSILPGRRWQPQAPAVG
jgi:4'-phosphopantetheinyl transferase